jgi:hypothetical protein
VCGLREEAKHAQDQLDILRASLRVEARNAETRLSKQAEYYAELERQRKAQRERCVPTHTDRP